jgi:hypothetical protein
MHTSLLLLALLGPDAAPLTPAPEAPRWETSYAAAQAAGREQGKPLAVFVGKGPAAWERLTEEGKPTLKSRRLLAEGYVCVYLDADTPAGRRLAEALEVGAGPGLVLSTRDGDGQAFWHQGRMSPAELDDTLQKYANGTAVLQTEMLDRVRYATAAYTNGSVRPAAYAAQPTTTATYAVYPTVPTYSFGGFGGYSGGFGGGFGGGGGGC